LAGDTDAEPGEKAFGKCGAPRQLVEGKKVRGSSPGVGARRAKKASVVVGTAARGRPDGRGNPSVTGKRDTDVNAWRNRLRAVLSPSDRRLCLHRGNGDPARATGGAPSYARLPQAPRREGQGIRDGRRASSAAVTRARQRGTRGPAIPRLPSRSEFARLRAWRPASAAGIGPGLSVAGHAEAGGHRVNTRRVFRRLSRCPSATDHMPALQRGAETVGRPAIGDKPKPRVAALRRWGAGAFSTGQSSSPSLPRSMASVFAVGARRTEPASRWSRPIKDRRLDSQSRTSSLMRRPKRARSPSRATGSAAGSP